MFASKYIIKKTWKRFETSLRFVGCCIFSFDMLLCFAPLGLQQWKQKQDLECEIPILFPVHFWIFLESTKQTPLQQFNTISVIFVIFDCSVCLPQWKYCIVLSVFVLGEGAVKETLQAVHLLHKSTTCCVSYNECFKWAYRFILLPLHSFMCMWDVAEVVCVCVHPVLISVTTPPPRLQSSLTLCPSYRRLLFIL